MSKYYSILPLLAKKDKNGNKPAIYMVSSNRSAGKTTSISRYLVDEYLKGNGSFLLSYRFADELSMISDKFFGEIGGLFFNGHTMESHAEAKGAFHVLTLDDKVCGYACAVNTANKLKKYSHLFKDVSTIFMDEFQAEDNRYASNEVEKFTSMHTSVARGGGSQSRYVRCILASNPVTILNPYYSAMGVTREMRSNQSFTRGTGWVLEQHFNKSASRAMAGSAFNQAFSGLSYTKSLVDNRYLNDSKIMIGRLSGATSYVATLVCDGKRYGIRTNGRKFHVSDRVETYSKVFVSKEPIGGEFGLQNNRYMLLYLRNAFDNAKFCFKNQECKQASISTLAY